MVARRVRRPKEARQHIVLRLAKGWRYEPARRRFLLGNQESFSPGPDLPKYTRILFQVPSLALELKHTQAQDELARGIQVVPPRGTSLGRILGNIRSWPCTESAWIAPTPSLPGP